MRNRFKPFSLVVGAAMAGVATAAANAQPCEITPLRASDGAPGDRFGWSSDISGDYVVVGAYQAGASNLIPIPEINSGAAYLFERDGLAWNEIGRIRPTAQQGPLALTLLGTDDDYGYSVAIDGRNVVVGARKHDADGGIIDSGAAYVFRRNLVGEWVYVTELVADDGAPGRIGKPWDQGYDRSPDGRATYDGREFGVVTLPIRFTENRPIPRGKRRGRSPVRRAGMHAVRRGGTRCFQS